MRISQISIEGFGHFRQTKFDLGAGLNVVYGPNEAGKSTLLAFIRAMLFGFEAKKSGLNRYEPIGGGAFGGELLIETEDSAIKIRRERRKKAIGDLMVFGRNGADLGEDALQQVLGGVSRSLFYQVFCFGLHELMSFEQLADSGAASEALLVAGVQGSKRLPLALGELEKEWGSIYRPKGSTGRLNQLLHELEDITARRQELGNLPVVFAQKTQQLSQVQASILEIETRLQFEEDTGLRLSRLVDCLELLATWSHSVSQLQSLPDFSLFPLSEKETLMQTSQKWQETSDRIAKLNLLLEDKKNSREELRRHLAETSAAKQLEEALTRFQSRVEWLHGLPDRKRELEASFEGLKNRHRELGLAGPMSALTLMELPTSRRAQLVKLNEVLLIQNDRLAALSHDIQQTELEGRQLSEPSAESTSNKTKTDSASNSEQLTHRISRIRDLLELRREVARQEETVAELETQSAAWRKQRETAQSVSSPIVLTLTLTLLATLSIAGSNFLESRLARVSIIGGASLLILAAAIYLWSAFRRRQGRDWEDTFSKSISEKRAAFESLRLEERALLSELQLQPNATDHDVSELRATLEHALEEERRLARLREIHAFEKARIEQALDEKLKQQSELSHAYESTCSALLSIQKELGLKQLLEPMRALEVWDEVGRLKEKWVEHEKNKAYLASEEKQLELELGRVLNAARQCGLTFENPHSEPEDVVHRCDAWFSQQRQLQANLEKIEFELLKLQSEQNALSGVSVTLKETVNELLQRAGTSSVEGFLFYASQAEQWKSADSTRLQCVHRIELIAHSSPEEVKRVVDSEGGAEKLTQRLMESQNRLHELKGKLQSCFGERGALQQSLIDLERKHENEMLRQKEEFLRAQILQESRRYWVSRVSTELLLRAKTELEQTKQPKVVLRASQLFDELTQGRYRRVLPSIEDDKELSVVDLNENRWSAQQLSRGTREMLYLAFRLAVIEDFSTRQASLPVILDDVIVNFDALRTARMLKTLSVFSQTNQIIAFTCHPSQRDVFASHGARILSL